MIDDRRPAAARGFLAPGGTDIIFAPPPLFSFPFPYPPLRSTGLRSRPLNAAIKRSLGSAVSSPVGSGAKPQPPTILVHFEDLETLMMTSKMCFFYAHNLSFHAHGPASTELTELPHLLSALSLLLAPGSICPCLPYSPPLST